MPSLLLCKFVKERKIELGKEMKTGYVPVKERRLQEKHEFREYIKLSDDRVLDVAKYGIELLADDEVFVQVDYAEHYWISNYGRLVNNLRKDGSFRFHKWDSGNDKRGVHWTIVSYEKDGSAIHDEVTHPEELVAQYFLIRPKYCNRIWHIDRNVNNNHYKNLIYVTNKEYDKLLKKAIGVSEIDREQEYYSYNVVKGNPAYRVWNNIYRRCYGLYGKYGSNYLKKYHYGSFMCDSWKNDIDAFAEWYSANYYECNGETMMVDKDLLCRGNREYAPDKCCLLPRTINSALSSATKKRNFHKLSHAKEYPIGVEYDTVRKKYLARIRPFGHDKMEKIHYWDTEEEAFQEYKLFKESELRILAVRYRSMIPDYIFDALIQYEVLPYSPYKE